MGKKKVELRPGFTRRSDGKLQYRFSYKGQRYSVYGYTYQECEEKRSEKIDKLKNHLLLCNERITLSEYYVEWQKTRELSIEESTRYTNDQRWARMKPYIGNEKVAHLETHHIVKMRNEMAKKLSPTTVNDELILLKTIMESAIEDKIRIDNPCRSRSLKPLKADEDEASETYHRALTIEEQTSFFKEAEKRTWYYELLVFMIATGCRVGEVCALRWSDIDFKKNLIKINKTVTRVSHKEYVVKNTPKTKKSKREIPLSQLARQALAGQKSKTVITNISGLIFTTNKGTMVNKSLVNAAIANVIKKNNKYNDFQMELFTSHALRATFATRAIEQGMQPQTLKTILGHSSLKMTMDLYAHVLPNTKQDEMARVEIVV